MSTITGEATFNNSNNNGTVDGRAAFYGESANNGDITGAAAFVDGAQNNGEIGALCDAAPVVTESPESLFTGPQIGFEDTSYSVVAEENPWVDTTWSIEVTSGYNNKQTVFVSGAYDDVKNLDISTIGGLPGGIWKAEINCNLSNPMGETQTDTAIYKQGHPPTIAQEANGGNINLTEGDNIVLPFSAISWADNVTIAVANGPMPSDPVVFEMEFATQVNTDSLDGGRKITLDYLNLNMPATLEYNNASWWFRITDVYGTSIAPNQIYTYVTAPQ